MDNESNPDAEIRISNQMQQYNNPAFEGEESNNGEEKPNHGDDSDTHSATSNHKDNAVIRCIVFPLEISRVFCKTHSDTIVTCILVLLALGYTGYMIAALIIDFNRAVSLLVIFCLVIFFKLYALVRDNFGDKIWEAWEPIYNMIADNIYWLKWIFIVILLGLLATWIALDTSKRPEQLISMGGYIVFIFCLFLGSKTPGRVRWRPVFWGLGIQICLGMFILRTQAGYDAFSWMGNIAQTFLDFVDAGSIFVFGDTYYEHYFAFKVLPIIIYFGAFISILYYLGAMQWLIFKIAWLMQFSLGTSATESTCAAGNIFVGQTESPLLIRPYIHDLTTSELHAVMTCGFGTIAGSVLGAYLGFGIEAVYLITACVMASPCALAVSKLLYPETQESKFLTTSGLELEPTSQRNIIEAAFVGASDALPLVLNIAANLIAFISLLAAINAGLSWYGGMVDFPELSFELICSYVFLPVTYLMGIEWADCFKCAELLGVKIFLNEFVAYEQLAVLIENKDNGTIPRTDEDGTVNWISNRSEAIITYALCGFANISSLGIMLGGLASMCPERQGEMTKIVIRALIGGIFVSILNASLAGFLYLPSPDCNQLFSYDNWNTTELKLVYQCCEEEVNTDKFNSACRCCQYDWFSNGFDTLDCAETCV